MPVEAERKIRRVLPTLRACELSASETWSNSNSDAYNALLVDPKLSKGIIMRDIMDNHKESMLREIIIWCDCKTELFLECDLPKSTKTGKSSMQIGKIRGSASRVKSHMYSPLDERR